MIARLDRWFHQPVPCHRIRRLRILLGTFTASYLALRLPFFLRLANNDPERWQATGVLNVLDGPPSSAVGMTLPWIALTLAVLYATGIGFRVVGPVLTAVLLVLFSYRSSWGQILHFEHLVVLHIGLLSLSGAGRRSRHAVEHGPGWPVRLMALVTAITYVIAGWAKVRFGGFEWLDGDTLANHVAWSNVRLDVLGEPTSPIGRWSLGHRWIFGPAAVAAVTIELGAPVALLGGRFRDVWVAAAWLMHVGIAATMYIVFPMPLFLVAFAPLYVHRTNYIRFHQ